MPLRVQQVDQDTVLRNRAANAAAIAAGGTVVRDVDVTPYDVLEVVAELVAGAAAGDLTITVTPFLADQSGSFDTALNLAPETAAGPVLGTGRVIGHRRYNVRAFGFLRVTLTNTSATARTVNLDLFAD